VRKLFVLDEGVEIPSVPASASSKSRGRYPLVRGRDYRGNHHGQWCFPREIPVWGVVEPLRVYEQQTVR